MSGMTWSANSAASISKLLPKAWALVIVGAVILLGSGALGFVWLNRTPDLHPVPFGERATITASHPDTATIFTTSGLTAAASCRVTQDSGAVALGEPGRYQQFEGMESTYVFTTTRGATYTVSCGQPGQSGRFAVAEVGRFPEAAFLAAGSIGLLLCVGGLVLVRAHPGSRGEQA